MSRRTRWALTPALLLLVAVALPGATSATTEPRLSQEAEPSRDPIPPNPVTALPLEVAPEPVAPPATLAAIAQAPGLKGVLNSPTGLGSPFYAPDERPASVFADAQLVSFYGFPGFPVMGILGAHEPDEAAREVTRLAAQYDALNGERGVQPALHLIVGVAHMTAGEDGLYHTRIGDELLSEYVETARRHGLLLFVDIQIGWSEALTEVQALEEALREPFVHVALDPEFATKRKNDVPGIVIGNVNDVEVNAVQRYLAGLVRDHDLPPKVLMLHQFREDMLIDPDGFAQYPEVEIAIDMDGFGGRGAKLSNYDFYALSSYSERPGIKLFFDWDEPLMTPAEIQSLARPPDFIIYQ